MLLCVCRSAASSNPQDEDTLMARQLLVENSALTAQLEASERENFEIAEFLRKELSARDDRLTALHARLDEV